VQEVLDGHDTANSSLPLAVAGLAERAIDQLSPFHRSASVRLGPLLVV
jgi:hypothetical protein